MDQMTADTTRGMAADRSLQTTVARFNDAFNRFDAREVASFWAEDGTLLNPIGNFGQGRAGVERVFAEDARTFLGETRSRFTIVRARPVGSDCALLDLDHEIDGARMPGAENGHMKLHNVILARRTGDRWEWLDARPYAFVQRPPQIH